MIDADKINTLRAAAEEIRVGYRRRYGSAYAEAHECAAAIPELLGEIDELRERLRLIASSNGDKAELQALAATP